MAAILSMLLPVGPLAVLALLVLPPMQCRRSAACWATMTRRACRDGERRSCASGCSSPLLLPARIPSRSRRSPIKPKLTTLQARRSSSYLTAAYGVPGNAERCTRRLRERDCRALLMYNAVSLSQSVSFPPACDCFTPSLFPPLSTPLHPISSFSKALCPKLRLCCSIPYISPHGPSIQSVKKRTDMN